MKTRLIKWIAFSLIFGVMPLGIKAGVLYLCGNAISYNDVYSEIIFFDLALNVGMINEAIALKEHKAVQTFLISFGLLATIVLVVLFTLLIMISYKYVINLDFTKMVLPTTILSVASIVGSLSTQIMVEVEQ